MSVQNSLLLILLWNSILFVGAYVNVDIVTSTATGQHFCANDSQTRCITLSQCLSSVHECISDNSTLNFEAGVHFTVGLESGMVLIDRISNVTLLGRNSTIQCEIGIGFLFKEVDHLLIRGLAFHDCGAAFTRDVVMELFPSQYRRTFEGAKSALTIGIPTM